MVNPPYRSVGESHNPAEVPTRQVELDQSRNAMPSPSPYDELVNDDNVSSDTDAPNVSPAGEDTLKEKNPLAERRQQLREQRKSEKKSTFKAVRF